MKGRKLVRILMVVIVINMLIVLGCIIHMRHNIAKKINKMVERPIAELNLSAEEKLKDFTYFYDCIATSLPLDTLQGIEEQYNIDFVERYDKYVELVSSTQSDLEFFAVMRAIMEDVPTYHTNIAYPQYRYYETLGCWNLDRVLTTKNIYSKSVYWNTLLKNECKAYFEKLPKVDSFFYNRSTGKYISKDGAVLLEIDGVDIDCCAEDISAQPIAYDYINQKAYRGWIQFYDIPYSDSLSEEVVITIQTKEGEMLEKVLYSDMVADVLDGYAESLGVRIPESSQESVMDEVFYSYCDAENNTLYMNIGEISRWALCEVPQVLEECKCENVILDLRNNYGGYTNNIAIYLYPYLYAQDIEVRHKWYLPDTKYAKKIVESIKAHFELELKKSDYSSQNGIGDFQPYLASENQTTLKGGDNIENERNVYVLVSGKTASAADWLAAILKDNDLAVLVGSNTAGEGIGNSFLVDYLGESGLLYTYTPQLAYNSDGTNNAIVGTAPHVYVREAFPDTEEYTMRGEDPYIYENRLEWDSVLIETLKMIQDEY